MEQMTEFCSDNLYLNMMFLDEAIDTYFCSNGKEFYFDIKDAFCECHDCKKNIIKNKYN